MDWTLRVVSKLLIGPQEKERNYIYIFTARSLLVPTSATCTDMIVKGVIIIVINNKIMLLVD